jgi:hypothetical protein
MAALVRRFYVIKVPLKSIIEYI